MRNKILLLTEIFLDLLTVILLISSLKDRKKAEVYFIAPEDEI